MADAPTILDCPVIAGRADTPLGVVTLIGHGFGQTTWVLNLYATDCSLESTRYPDATCAVLDADRMLRAILALAQSTGVIAIPEEGVKPDLWLRVGPAMWKELKQQLVRRVDAHDVDGKALIKLRAAHTQLRVKYLQLVTAIREHRDQRGHDRCWLDDRKLYEALGEPLPDDVGLLPNDEEMLDRCRQYIALRRRLPETEADKHARLFNAEAIAEAERRGRIAGLQEARKLVIDRRDRPDDKESGYAELLMVVGRLAGMIKRAEKESDG